MFRRRLVALALSLALGTSAADVLINNGDLINFIIITAVFVFDMNSCVSNEGLITG